MIQRKQTIYFFIALLLVISPLLDVPFFTYSNGTTGFEVGVFGIQNNLKPTLESRIYYWPIILNAVLLVTVIFSYKDRKRQITFAWLALLLNLTTTVWILTDSISYSMECKICQPSNPIPQLGFYLFISAFIFILLGIFGVRKDKKLIDSLNRIR